MSIRNFFTKRRIIWTTVILIVVALIASQIFKPASTDGILTESARVQDLKSTVLATGQVTSSTDLSLSFKGSGVVRRVYVNVGDKVKAGQLLANLDQRDQAAALTSARGSLASAQANYQRVIDGASSEQVAVAQKAVDAAQVALDNTKAQQELAVQNAYRTLLSSGLTAEPTDTSSTGTITLSGTYSGNQEGKYRIAVYYTGDGLYYQTSGLGNVNGPANRGTPVSLGNGLYATFSSTGTFSSSVYWDIFVPNTKSSVYLSNSNAYQSALNARTTANASAQAALDSAIAQLNLQKAQARPADVKAAQAQILSAQGQVQAAQAAYEGTEIRASSDGTVTKIDIKVGELANAQTPVIVVQDVGNLYLEANISEANIAEIQTGQKVEVTFDAQGPDSKYTATVSSIDPASTVVSGVVNYKIKALLDKIEEIKPGMTANMSVLTGEKSGVIAVPTRAVIQKDGKKFVRVITDPKKKTYNEVEVTTGFEADGGLVEISSGITAGQEIVTFIDTK
jgi:HlyD family secretion protein